MPGQIPRKPMGDSNAADHIKWLHSQQRENRLGDVTGVATYNTVAGKLILPSRAPGGGGSTTLSVLIIRLAEADHLVCREVSLSWLPTTGKTKIEAIGSTDIIVAKPEDLKCAVATAPAWGAGPAWSTATMTYALDSSEPYMDFSDPVNFPDATTRPPPPTSPVGANAFGEIAADYDVGGALYQVRNNWIRTVTIDGISEDHRVIPVWKKGDLITVAELENSETIHRTDGYVLTDGDTADFVVVNSTRVWARI